MKSTQIFSYLFSVLLLGCGSAGHNPVPAPKPARYVYVLNSGDENISQFRIEDEGKLVPLATPHIATGSFPTAMVLDASEKYLYVSNKGDDTISQYEIQINGQLKSIGTPIATGGFTQDLAVSPNGQFLYALNLQNDSIFQYAISSQGTLTLVSSQAQVGPQGMVFSKAGNFAYVINVDNTISQFSVAANGALSALTPATITSQGCPSGPVSQTTTLLGEYIYVLSCYTEEVEIFSRGAGGGLTSRGVVKTGTSPQGMTLAGSYLYVTNAIDATVSMFSVNLDGSLASLPQPPVPAGVMPETLAVDPVRGYAYILDFSSNEVAQYTVMPDGSLLRSVAMPALSTGMSPVRILLKH